ncbi:MAG TPA: hypothetical protein VGM01_12185 [Ktedonobacteraceae bacterium]
MSEMKGQYITRVLYYLRHELHCVVEPLGDVGYHITFPAGTVEETYAGQSTQWTYMTLLRFPTGQEIDKYIKTRLSDMTKSTTTLGIPKRVLAGPEPPAE